MSILINSHSVSSVSYSHSTARTTLSINLALSLGPACDSVFLLTSCTARFGNFSASIVCDVSPHTPPALVLGRDWASLLRDSLLSSGVRVGDTFDVWHFLVDPAHPHTILHVEVPDRIVPPFNFDAAPLHGDPSSGINGNTTSFHAMVATPDEDLRVLSSVTCAYSQTLLFLGHTSSIAVASASSR
ncbi:hypothetical protein DFH09DRAFT_1079248 [Mycena vulgaris]|nr:hypothetical protein DFH09DRAFT_1079248 [Mycena vulgaris]